MDHGHEAHHPRGAHGEDLVFFNGKPVENPHENHHHVSPKIAYWGVFFGLLVLTGVTYGVSYANLGSASLTVAMIVAVMKASLVVAFFMHLAHEERFFLFIFLAALVFVGIFFTFTLFDMSTTGELNDEADIQFKRIVEDRAEAIENVPAPAGDEHAASAH